MKSLFLITIIFCTKLSISQNIKFDIDLLFNTLNQPSVQNNQSNLNKKKLVVKILQFPFNQALTLYQKNISVQISSSCLFEPSCSRFSRNAISEFGSIKGILLTADRLSRCNSNGGRSIPTIRFLEDGKIDDKACRYHVSK